MRGVRLLLVNSHGDDLAAGGAERYVALLRAGLERAGHTCTVLSAYPVTDGRADGLGVLHRRDWRRSEPRRVADHIGSALAAPGRRLAAAIRAGAPDLVHTHNLFGVGSGVWESARRLGIPVVHTLHDYGLLCPRTTLRRIDGSPCRPHPLLCGLRTRALARWAPALSSVIGVSDHVLAVHDQLFAAPVTRHVIRAPAAGRGGAPAAPPGAALAALGFIGRLDDHKGVAALLAAAPALAGAGVRVRIAGDGPLRAAVAAAPAVDYAGRLSGADLDAFLASCDAGIVPSQWEEPGLSFAALQWLGAGRPVLATDAGGLAELPGAGVRRIAPGAAAIAAAVTALRTEAAFAALCAGVPDHATAVQNARCDADRFIADHLRVYASARR